jgi:hypothetical protein
MNEFIARHAERITGVLSGFDRLVFRGTLRPISYPEGMMGYLSGNNVRQDGEVPKSFRGEVVTDLKVAGRRRADQAPREWEFGEVVRQGVHGTSPGSVLRAETAIHQAGEFRVYRRKEGDQKGKKSWRVLRGGVAGPAPPRGDFATSHGALSGCAGRCG